MTRWTQFTKIEKVKSPEFILPCLLTMKERLVIIIVAIIAGLFITSAGFFIYQSTKKDNDTPIAQKKTQSPPSNNQPPGTLFVKVLEPSNESLTQKRTLVVKGTTNPDNLIIISTNLQDVETKPNQDGNFSISIDIDAGANELITRAIAPSGNSTQDIRTITYSTEDF